MTSPSIIELQKSASLASLYLKALLKHGRLSAESVLPNLRYQQRGVSLDPKHIAAYAEICGFSPEQGIPVSYPHMLVFPLHLSLLTDKLFPAKLLGLIHVKNRLCVHKPLLGMLEQPVDLAVELTGQKLQSKGLEFEIESRLSIAGQLLWSSTSTLLSRCFTGIEKDSTAKPIDTSDGQAWSLAADLGRRYAKVSGDSNPIHLTALSAKLFGFKRAIAHGMWSKARCLSELVHQGLLPDDKFAVEVEFKRPIFLPSQVQFCYRKGDDNVIDFLLLDEQGSVPHLQGRVIPFE